MSSKVAQVPLKTFTRKFKVAITTMFLEKA